MGFETELDKTVDTSKSGPRARLGQVRQGLGHARKFTPLQARLTIDDQLTVDCELFSLSITNQKFLNPLADDKLLISLSDQPGTRQVGSYLWQKLRRGTSPLEDTATSRFLATRIVIETTPATGIMVDGKVAGRTPIAIRLTDKHVRFITEKAANVLRG